MPPKKSSEGQVFTFEEMACTIAAMEVSGVTLGNKVYDLMATMDGNRTASGYQHKFRAVKNRAKELAATLKGESATPKSKKSPKKRTPASSKKRDNSAIATDGDDAAEDIETPSKKFKEEPVEEPDGGMNGIESFFDNAMA